MRRKAEPFRPAALATSCGSVKGSKNPASLGGGVSGISMDGGASSVGLLPVAASAHVTAGLRCAPLMARADGAKAPVVNDAAVARVGDADDGGVDIAAALAARAARSARAAHECGREPCACGCAGRLWARLPAALVFLPPCSGLLLDEEPDRRPRQGVPTRLEKPPTQAVDSRNFERNRY